MTKYNSEKHIEYSPKHHFNTQIIDDMLDEAGESLKGIESSVFELEQKYKDISSKILAGPPKPGFLNNYRMEILQKTDASKNLIPQEYRVADLTSNFIPSWLTIKDCAFSPFFSGFLNRESYLIMNEFDQPPFDTNADTQKNEYKKKFGEDDLYVSFERDMSKNVISVLPKSSNANLLIGLRKQGEDVPYKRMPLMSGSVNTYLLDRHCNIIDVIAYAAQDGHYGFSIENMYASEFSSQQFPIIFKAVKKGLYRFFGGITPSGEFNFSVNNEGQLRSTLGMAAIELDIGDIVDFYIPGNSILHYFGYNLF